MNKPLHLLFVYSTRGRRERFIDGMNSIQNNLYDTENFSVVVIADVDDYEMINVPAFPNTTYCYGHSTSKVHAINRGAEMAQSGMWDDYDVIICMSDDMRFMLYGFDEILREQFADGDLDKLIHLPDQDAKSALATMYIAGRTYFERFKFIYNPAYDSLFCDNEVHEIAQQLGKYRYVDMQGVLIHLNPAYGHLPKDKLFEEQQRVGWSKDQETYNERKARNFDL